MKLSIIITSYKFKEYISQCIDSVLAQQTDFGFEVLVRDDGTNDGTFELLNEKYKSNTNVRILDSSTNVGAVENILILIGEAKGKYVAHIDGDDYLIDNDYYRRAVKFLDENPTYSLYTSGYKYIRDGDITPTDHWLVGGKSDFGLADMLVENYASFGRVFKNIEFRKEIFKDIPYPDWVFNFEILKHGKCNCETNYCVGLYRMHAGGMFSITSEETKLKNNLVIRYELSKRYARIQHKAITIVDSFVHNDKIREKLMNTLEWLRDDGHDVLLITNTPVDKDILNNTKFCIYDSRNQLFQKSYTNINKVDFWKSIGNTDTVAHDVISGMQKHGLSVLINLFNALDFAKGQGYTHFQRFEADDIYKNNSREYIKSVPFLLDSNNKHGLFYYNNTNNPPDVSFHYYYCNIDTFLNKIKRISCENDYVKYLDEFYKNVDFKNVETFLYDHLKKNGDGEILKRDCNQMYEDFSDTIWNTETSISNYENKYFSSCTTKIYKVRTVNKVTGETKYRDDYVVLTHLFTDKHVIRKVIVEKNDGGTYELTHPVSGAGSWVWNVVPADTKAINVYEDNRLLYIETAPESICYIEFKE